MPGPKTFVSVIVAATLLGTAYAESDRNLKSRGELPADINWYVLAVEHLSNPVRQRLASQLNTMPPDPQLVPRAAVLLQSRQPARFAASNEGVSIRSAQGRYRLHIGADVQFDGRTFYGAPPTPANTFLVRRARPVVTGSVGDKLDFRFMPDFGGGEAQILDAYGDLRFASLATVRAGQFKVPLGLEQLQSDTNLVFMERSLVSDLLPNREDGLQLGGAIADRLQYQLALLSGAPDGGNSGVRTAEGATGMARIIATPFATTQRQTLRGLGFGVAASQGRSEGHKLASYKTSLGEEKFFAYEHSVRTAGDRTRFSPQMYFYSGPFGFMAEYAVSSQLVENPAKYRVTNHGYELTASWMLTGEDNSFGRIVPKTVVEAGRWRWRHAVQLASRYDVLIVDPAAFSYGLADASKSAQAAREWAVGVNYYVARNARLMFDYGQTHFAGGAPAGNRAVEQTFAQRLQLSF